MTGRRKAPSDSDGNDAETAGDPEPQGDELHVQVSDLRRPTYESAAYVPWRQRRVQLPRPVVDVALAVTLVALLLVATPIGSALVAFAAHPTLASSVKSIGSPSPISARLAPLPYPTPTLDVPAIGTVAATCAPETPLVDFGAGETSAGAGGPDVWFIASSAKPGYVQLPQSNYTQTGWPVPVTVFIRHGFAQTITLTGHDLTTGYSLWLSPDANNPGSIAKAAPLATIDPAQSLAHTRDARWDIWSGVLYLPGAGCYIIQANWPGNGWFIDFAAGR
ncbi:MAG TPA: hypothetical protein VH591_00570 [Ktedonobacterales bacterium]|jgi:hypothetical protein